LAKFVLPPDEGLPLSKAVLGEPSLRLAGDRQKWGEISLQVSMLKLPDSFRPIDVFQLVYAQVPNGQFGREGFANQIDSYARDKHLPAVGRRAQAGAVIDSNAVVVPGSQIGLTCVDGHAHA
jgi:hypothetical protein